MFLNEKIKKIVYFFICQCFLLVGILGASFLMPTKAFAAPALDPAPYLQISTTAKNFAPNSTIFLDDNQELTITFGKPVGEQSSIEDGVPVFNDDAQIGASAFSHLAQSFGMSINGVPSSELLSTLQNEQLLQFNNYYFSPDTTIQKTFVWMELKINLAHTHLFQPGEYHFSFTPCLQHTGTDLAQNIDVDCNFSLLIFKSSDYFTADKTAQNVQFDNVEKSNHTSLSYGKYYYFNYSNLHSSISNHDKIHLPTLTFDATKFSVDIFKTINGVRSACTVKMPQSPTGSPVTLTDSTLEHFLNATYNDQTKKISVTFNDIGEYVLSYSFVYQTPTGELAKLESPEINAVNQRLDMLHVFGYQMYYGGSVDKQYEFKAFGEKFESADVTYLVEDANESYIRVSDTANIDDTAILSIINQKHINPVSTNLPAVVLNTNAKLDTDLSKYYTCNQSQENGNWTLDNATGFEFANNMFTESGTYLLRAVYSFDNYSSQDNSIKLKFVQYFFFTINKTLPEITIRTTNNVLANGAFTNQDVTVALEAQSPFNSPLNAEIYIKPFAGNTYTLLNTIASGNEIALENQGHYHVKMIYGQYQNKSKSTYFTIDKTEIGKISVVPVQKNPVTNKTEKIITTTNGAITFFDVDFFTSDNVIVEWNEKNSGAKTFAFYKFIPFKTNSNNPSIHITDPAISGITTTAILNIERKTYDKAPYQNALNILNDAVVFSTPGLYMLYVTDEAGHTAQKNFCIDKSEIQIMQQNENSSKTITRKYDTILTDTVFAWGKYKLIEVTGINTDDLQPESNIDAWLLGALQDLYAGTQDTKNLRSFNKNLYLSPEICTTFALRTGNSINLQTSATNRSIITIAAPNSDISTELTYTHYLIDETNKYFAEFAGANKPNAQTLVQNANKYFQTTTITDGAEANFWINNDIQNTNDMSGINPETSSPLSIAGTADSSTTTNTTPNLRTKYFFTTGINANNPVSVITYRLKLEIGENLNVETVTQYYYPFVVDANTGFKKLSDVATKTEIYNIQSTNQSSLVELAGSNNDGFWAFNLSPSFNAQTRSYQTLAGKYVIVREYDNPTTKRYDFDIRENVIIVDREEIISSPEMFAGKAISPVGGGIFVNMLDGHTDAVQFANINTSQNIVDHIFQTNKLPVVAYVPIAKYGYMQKVTNNFQFHPDKTLSHFLQLDETTGRLIRFKFMEDEVTITTTSQLSNINFGTQITANFETNKHLYKNNAFDLSVSITKNTGEQILAQQTPFNYLKSNTIVSEGTYIVSITQNALYGQNLTEVFSTIKFSFQIIKNLPNFVFAPITYTINSSSFDTDLNGNAYTNNSGKIKVVWTNPNENTYLAKIDTHDNKIQYYFSTPNGTLASSITQVDENSQIKYLDNTSSQYFEVELPANADNLVLNVVMFNQHGIVPATQQAELESAVKQIKKLYIDRTAPNAILQSLIEKTMVINQTTTKTTYFADYTRTFVDITGKKVQNGLKQYNLPVATGPLAQYAFAVENTAQNPLSALFATKPAENQFFTEGYFYHIKPLDDLRNFLLRDFDISSAISQAKSYQSNSVTLFAANNYYQITEVDLAGNLTLYLIFVVGDNRNNNVVLQYESEQTDFEAENPDGVSRQILYGNLAAQQSIYAKGYIKLNLNLNNYDFMTFKLDDQVYFTSNALGKTQCLSLSSLVNIEEMPQTQINLADLLSFGVSSHRLVLSDSTNAQIQNYQFNIFVSQSKLSITPVSGTEQVLVRADSNSPEHFLKSISISVFNPSVGQYVTIYNQSNTFPSTSEVRMVQTGLTYAFTVTPSTQAKAYSYVAFDNYGNKTIEHHTADSFILSPQQKVQHHLGTTLITQINDENKPETNLWYYSTNQMIYNYSSADYLAYITIYKLALKDAEPTWQKIQDNIKISGQTNYAIRAEGITLCSVSGSPIHPTITQLLLYAPIEHTSEPNFKGSAYRFEITLVDQYDQEAANPAIDRLLINNLVPQITLKDKNAQIIAPDNAIYSEQIEVTLPVLDAKLTQNANIAPFMMTYSATISNSATSTPLISGTIIDQPDTYEIQTFASFEQEKHQLSSLLFTISESATLFYQVMVRDSVTGSYIPAVPTGNPYRYLDNNSEKICYNHFIFNDAFNNHTFEIIPNYNQMIECTELVPECIISGDSLTKIYQISNYNNTSHNISPYQTVIAITSIPTPYNNKIIDQEVFSYAQNDDVSARLTGSKALIKISKESTTANQIKIYFNSYFGLPENFITAKVVHGNSVMVISPNKQNSAQDRTWFTISNSGEYQISFSDVAGNTHLFTDTTTFAQPAVFTLHFIKGVSFLINGNAPIANAIYNDSVAITLPTALSSYYDNTTRPKIHVLRNEQEIDIAAQNGVYTISGTGYYTVYFDALVEGEWLRKEAYSFLIISSKEHRTNFEFAEFGNYEIVSVIKNQQNITSKIKELQNLSTEAALKNLRISLYDMQTGFGAYTIKINTNSGLFTSTPSGLEPEFFQFNFIIKQVEGVQIDLSVAKGQATTDVIDVKFNVYGLYQDLGECKVTIVSEDNKISSEYNITEEYINSLNGNYFLTQQITKQGTYYVQVRTASNTLLYSAKVIKNDPLNTVSILLIVGGVLAVAGLTVTFVLLRRRMKIK